MVLKPHPYSIAEIDFQPPKHVSLYDFFFYFGYFLNSHYLFVCFAITLGHASIFHYIVSFLRDRTVLPLCGREVACVAMLSVQNQKFVGLVYYQTSFHHKK